MCHVFLRLNAVIQWCASTRRNGWWRYWKVHFVTFKSCHLVTEKHFPIYDLAWNQQYFYSCLYALKPFPNMCTLIFMFNFFVLKDGIWSPSEWVQKLIRGCEFLASDNNLLLYHTITSEQCFSCTLIGYLRDDYSSTILLYFVELLFIIKNLPCFVCFIYSGHVKSIIQSCKTGQHSSFWGGYKKEISHKKGIEKLVILCFLY